MYVYYGRLGQYNIGNTIILQQLHIPSYILSILLYPKILRKFLTSEISEKPPKFRICWIFLPPNRSLTHLGGNTQWVTARPTSRSRRRKKRHQSAPKAGIF